MKNEDFNDIYRKYLGFSVNNVKKIVKDRMLAEDISQEVFYHLYMIKDSLDISCERKLKALIFYATLNKSRDYLKKPWKKRESLFDENMHTNFADGNLNPEAVMIRKEEMEYKRQVINKLRKENPQNFDIITKVKCFGYPPDIVAEEYGITRNNVNNRILRTRKWLNKELKKLKKSL